MKHTLVIKLLYDKETEGRGFEPLGACARLFSG